MRRVSSKRRLSVLSELNITPLLDLAFILLIIFMITTPVMENKLDLLIPTSSTSQTSSICQVHTINIQRDNSLTFDGNLITIEELKTQLYSLHTSNPYITVAIRAHEKLPIQSLVYIIDLLGQIGISKVGVLTRQVTPAS